MKPTEKQTGLLTSIKAGARYQTQTGTREGNMVRTLMRRGWVDSRHKAWTPGETTYHGRRLPGFMWYGGLFLTDEGEKVLARAVGADL